jgi:hypothetical protein
MELGMEERVSEATLCFYKSFWNTQKFSDSVNGEEGRAFLENRVDACREITWDGVIVSLIHDKNASSRKIPQLTEPNGNHFGWDDELFRFISGLVETAT